MTAHHNWMFSIIAFENLLLLRFPKWDVREDFKKKHCIFYDIWQKGRGSKDQNQILEKKLNLDKFLDGVGKRLQCHKNSYLKNLVFYCLESAL